MIPRLDQQSLARRHPTAGCRVSARDDGPDRRGRRRAMRPRQRRHLAPTPSCPSRRRSCCIWTNPPRSPARHDMKRAPRTRTAIAGHRKPNVYRLTGNALGGSQRPRSRSRRLTIGDRTQIGRRRHQPAGVRPRRRSANRQRRPADTCLRSHRDRL